MVSFKDHFTEYMGFSLENQIKPKISENFLCILKNYVAFKLKI